MRPAPRARPPRARRALRLASLAAALAIAVAAGCERTPPAPEAGTKDYQRDAFVAVPFGLVNALGGNLVVARPDLDFDTRLGNLALGATWNSASPAWRWSFELHYDGTRFVDASGAVYDAAAVANGAAIPGSVWVRLDARRLRSKGGLVHEFAGDGRLAAVRWASGAHPRLEYRTLSTPAGPRVGSIVQVAAPGDETVMARLAWDAGGRLTSLEDRAGRRALFGWNTAGQLVQARDAFDVARGLPGFRYAYADGRLVSVQSSEGVRAEYAYAGPRLVRARALGLGDPAVSFAYAGRTGGGFETRVTDPLGHVTKIGWDARRRVTDVENGAGERTRWTYAGGLRPSSRTAPDGTVVRWTWSDDDVATMRDAAGRVIAYAWASAAEDRSAPWQRPLLRASDALGLLEERAYDAQGRLVRTANGAGETQVFGWSGQNLLASRTDPSGLETRFGNPGEHGHPRRTERGGIVETLDYDAVGNLVAGRGNGLLPPGVVSRAWDEDRNLAALEVAEVDFSDVRTHTITIEHRSDGQIARIERPYGGDSELVFDALGRAVERRDRSDGVWRTTRVRRDALGRVTELERPNGMRTAVQYDAAGRRSSIAHLRGGAFEAGAAFAWRAGRLEAIRDAAHGFAEERYAYDAAGRVALVTYPEGERVELSYDTRSRPVSERYRDASGVVLRTLQLGYDAAGRPVSIGDGGTARLERAYAGGRLVQERFGNGLERTYRYDGDGLLDETLLRDAAGALVERSRIEREVAVGIVSSVVWRASTSTYTGVTATTQENYWLIPVGEDAAGNRVGAWSQSPTAGLVPYAHDALGNLLRVGPDGDASARELAYDAERTRLRKVRSGTGALVHEYAWDEAGFALARDGDAIAWDGGGRPLAVGTRARFGWDALDRPTEATVDGVEVRMRFGGRVRADARGTPIAIEAGALRISLYGDHRYRHVDFRGNVKLVTDAAGRVVSHTRFHPYGSDREHGTPDPEAGFAQGRSAGDLVLLGTRLYDPDVGRFLAPDPVFQLVNQHAYADGNPVWFWDPDGRVSSVAIGIGMGVVGMMGGAAAIAAGATVAGAAVFALAAAFTIGVVAGDTGIAGPSAGFAGAAVGLLARAGPFGIPAAALSGFAIGQAFQDRGASSPGAKEDPNEPDPEPGGDATKVLELHAVPSSFFAPGPPTGGPSSPGCSPVALATTPGTRHLILRVGGVLLALGLALAADRRWPVRRTR